MAAWPVWAVAVWQWQVSTATPPPPHHRPGFRDLAGAGLGPGTAPDTPAAHQEMGKRGNQTEKFVQTFSI